MFTDKNFQVSSGIVHLISDLTPFVGKYDPRGKKIDKSQREQYEKFYELDDEEEEEQENQENQEEPEEEIQARQERQEQDSKPRRRGPNFNQLLINFNSDFNIVFQSHLRRIFIKFRR